MNAQMKNRHDSELMMISEQLHDKGWILLRDQGYDLPRFSQLMQNLCNRLTFDPAREYASEQTQKVDAGTAAVGLHIENGNTPLPPDIVAFHSALSATKGSQTTVCDGAEVYRHLDPQLQACFRQPMTVSRYLPRHLWQRYVAKASGLDDAEQVNMADLERFMQQVPGQSFTPAEQGGIDYVLTIQPVREDNLIHEPAFANALLGPSYNYDAPVYRFSDGSLVTQTMLDDLAALCETFTEEIAWQDGDVAVIDNKRIMHGRRQIDVPLDQRRLYIGMGSGFVL